MIVVASANGKIGIEAAVDVLRSGGTALDAVEVATRLVEANPDDHTVGFGGYPNLAGEVELDASIMDGRTLDAGAVGALKGYKYAISVARKVMNDLPHVMLVGDGAARFAAEAGFEQEDLLTDTAREVYQQGLRGTLSPEHEHWLSGGIDQNLTRLSRIATDPEQAAGTVNFIAIDGDGNIASAVSTSGWAWKYPGRVGDSPIIGAGNYADNRYGACACTGWGELAMRCGTARSVVLYMRIGFGLEQACHQAMNDIVSVAGEQNITMNFIAVNRDGRPFGVTTVPDRTYVWMTPDMQESIEEPRVVIELKQPPQG